MRSADVPLDARLQRRDRVEFEMPGLPLQTDAFILLRRPPADSFQSLTAFSPEHGTLLVLQRIIKNVTAGVVSLDLFDEVSLQLESRNQGQTWFVKESRLITRHAEIGRSYETLRLASALAALVARNQVPEESRPEPNQGIIKNWEDRFPQNPSDDPTELAE